MPNTNPARPARLAHIKLSRSFEPSLPRLATDATLDQLENGWWRATTIDKASGVGDDHADFPTRDDALIALHARGFDLDEGISLCSVCNAAVHASETDDLDRCARCRS